MFGSEAYFEQDSEETTQSLKRQWVSEADVKVTSFDIDLFRNRREILQSVKYRRKETKVHRPSSLQAQLQKEVFHTAMVS